MGQLTFFISSAFGKKSYLWISFLSGIITLIPEENAEWIINPPIGYFLLAPNKIEGPLPRLWPYKIILFQLYFNLFSTNL